MINNTWISLLNRLINTGKEVTCRGSNTLELINSSISVDMNHPILTVKDRKLNYRFMFGEAWWILHGSNRLSDIAQFMTGIKKFSDNGYNFNGAYGPKVIEQVGYAVDALTADIHSRQAVLTTWRENPRASKDIPCTISMQWFIRDDKLHCITNMRSSDAWLGVVYDVFNFAMVSALVAIMYNGVNRRQVTLGTLHLNAGSQHLYERDYEAAAKVIEGFDPDASAQCVGIDLEEYGLNPDDLVRDLYTGAKEDWLICSPFLRQVSTV